jgi:hypothetical protein
MGAFQWWTGIMAQIFPIHGGPGKRPLVAQESRFLHLLTTPSAAPTAQIDENLQRLGYVS